MTDTTEWEIFTAGRSASYQKRPVVSIHRRTLVPNRAAQAFLGEWVLLYYHAGRRQIGLRPVTEGTRGAYQLRRTTKQPNTATISGNAFLGYHGLENTAVYGAYAATVQDGMLVLQLPPAPE